MGSNTFKIKMKCYKKSIKNVIGNKNNTIGLKQGVVKLQPYNIEWEKDFKKEKGALGKMLGDVALDIQHVGSTAIYGMIAKPIIDINIAIKHLGIIDDLIKPLEKLGYRYHGGEPGKRLFLKGLENNITHHLFIIELDSDFWRNDLLFRDYLRKNKDVAQQYANLKQGLVEKFYNNRTSYSEGKSNFIETVLNKAKDFTC